MPKKKTNKQSDETPQEDVVLQLTQALQRERADAINIRRRHEQQITNLKSMVKADVVRELLPVIDNFERALKHVPKDLIDNDYIKGVNGVVRQFEQNLEKMGVEKIKTVGELFNPIFHEAVSVDEGEGSGTKEIISEELQSGYKIGEDIIRHAMVKIKLS